MNRFLLLIFLLNTNMISSQMVHSLLKDQIISLEQEVNLINQDRKEELDILKEEIKRQLVEHNSSELIFVCTHNSRRSQLAQLWMNTACQYYNVENIISYSGGTEATAFNSRMVDAVKRFGFNIERLTEGENPQYKVLIDSNDKSEIIMFSKKYDDHYNPKENFIAVMVCSQADRDCPFVPGAFSRVSLPYDDPKEFDGTNNESQAYDDKVKEIGREILYLVKSLKST